MATLVEQLAELGVEAKDQGKNCIRVDTAYGPAVYYGRQAFWQRRGKVYRGSVAAFAAWVKSER